MEDVFDQYQRLIAIHRQKLAGGCSWVSPTQSWPMIPRTALYGFSRDMDNDHVCVLVNRSNQEVSRNQSHIRPG